MFNRNPYKYIFETLLALWVVILAVLISFGFVARWIINNEMDEVKYAMDILSVSSEQRLLAEQSFFLSDLLIKSDAGQQRVSIRSELNKSANQLEKNHLKLSSGNAVGKKGHSWPA